MLGISLAVCVKLKGSVTDDLRAGLVLVGGKFQEAGHDGPAQEYAKAAEVKPPGWDVVQVSVVVGVVLDRHGYEAYEVGCGGVSDRSFFCVLREIGLCYDYFQDRLNSKRPG